MTIDKVVHYVLHTPLNTNSTILVSLLKQLIISYGGNPEIDPDNPNRVIVYDGGTEE